MSDQPKPTGEWTVEAREAAKTIQRNYDRATYKLDWLTGVIQDAINAAQPVGATGEWTADYVRDLKESRGYITTEDGWQAVADSHNAALAKVKVGK